MPAVSDWATEAACESFVRAFFPASPALAMDIATALFLEPVPDSILSVIVIDNQDWVRRRQLTLAMSRKGLNVKVPGIVNAVSHFQPAPHGDAQSFLARHGESRFASTMIRLGAKTTLILVLSRYRIII